MHCCSKCDIAYEDVDCPLCEANKEIDKLERKIQRLEDNK